MNEQLGNIAMALQAYGAGIGGNLGQFQQTQMLREEQARKEQERQTAAQEKRIQAAYVDAKLAKDFADQGRYDEIINLGVNRLELLKNFPDADPTDTQTIVQLSIAAKNGEERAKELLTNELDTKVQMGEAYGYLQRPKTKVVGKSLVTEDGKEIYSASEKPKLEIVQLARPGEEIKTIQSDGKGGFMDLRGNKIELQENDRIIEGSTLTGGTEALGLPKSEQTGLRDAEIATSQFVATANDAIQMLEDSPDINTFTAKAAGVVNNLQQEAKALAGATGIDFDVKLLDPSNHEDTFDALGIQNARMQSMITNLAYSRALANNPDGRISNADLNAAINEIGGNAADPRAFAEVLQDVIERTERGFKINYRIRTGEEYGGDLGVMNTPVDADIEALIQKYTP